MSKAIGTKLPREIHERLGETVSSAYRICLDYEAELEEEEKAGKDIERNLIYCRIIGYLFHYYPSDHALSNIVNEVLSCNDRGAFLKLGGTYFDYFVRAFRSNEEPIPTPFESPHPSRPSFDDTIKEAIEEAPQSHAAAKKKALVRDRFRCVITGRHDYLSVSIFPELQQEVGDAGVGNTRCAYILDESANANIISSSKKEGCASGSWEIMKRFGYERLREELNGTLIHRLENIMTLSSDVYNYFDRLHLWFVQTSEPHKYKLKARNTFALSGLPEYVTLATPDEDKLPLPSPAYLKLHATCCEVAHLSGAGEYVEKFYRDMEDTPVLADDA